MNASIENGMLTVSVPVQDVYKLSSSEKSYIVAQFNGKTDLIVDNQQLRINLNAYILNR